MPRNRGATEPASLGGPKDFDTANIGQPRPPCKTPRVALLRRAGRIDTHPASSYWWDAEFDHPLVHGATCYTDLLRAWHRSFDDRLRPALRATGTRHDFVHQDSGWGVLTLWQPTDAGLHLLHRACDPDDYFINRFESATDAAFRSASERDHALDLFNRHHVQRHKRADAPVRFEGERPGEQALAKPWQIPGAEIRISGWRWSEALQVKAYPNFYSRDSGLLDVLHVRAMPLSPPQRAAGWRAHLR